MAAHLKKPDVRTMQDWSIVVAETAIESEKYAAEEFRERREDIRKDNHLLVNSALCNATGPANKKRHEMAAFPG